MINNDVLIFWIFSVNVTTKVDFSFQSIVCRKNAKEYRVQMTTEKYKIRVSALENLYRITLLK